MLKQMELGLALGTLLCFFLNVVIIEAECPTNFLQLHSKCYYFSREPVIWMDAHFQCKDMNSDLVHLEHENQEMFLRSYLLGEYLAGAYQDSRDTVPNEYWIGASYDWKQKVWKWASSGKHLKYENFAFDKKESKSLKWACAILDPNAHYCWNARRCTDKKHFICQRKAANYTASQDNNIPIITPNVYKVFEEQASKDRNSQPGYIKRRPVRTKSTDNSRVKLICPKGYRRVKGMCYRFSKNTATWQDAYFTCDGEYNGTLAIVHDKKVDRALRRTYKRMGLKNHNSWIGGRYDWESMAWKWARNGDIIQHQAHDREVLRWHCLLWAPIIKDRWTSDICIKEKHYICQTKGTTIRFPGPQRVRGSSATNEITTSCRGSNCRKSAPTYTPQHY